MYSIFNPWSTVSTTDYISLYISLSDLLYFILHDVHCFLWIKSQGWCTTEGWAFRDHITVTCNVMYKGNLLQKHDTVEGTWAMSFFLNVSFCREEVTNKYLCNLLIYLQTKFQIQIFDRQTQRFTPSPCLRFSTIIRHRMCILTNNLPQYQISHAHLQWIISYCYKMGRSVQILCSCHTCLLHSTSNWPEKKSYIFQTYITISDFKYNSESYTPSYSWYTDDRGFKRINIGRHINGLTILPKTDQVVQKLLVNNGHSQSHTWDLWHHLTFLKWKEPELKN